MLTDAEPFLQRIRAYPDDDVPRLIFADWLDEQDGRAAERAAFIRVQVALAGLPDEDARRGKLLAEERGLLDTHRDEWEAPFRGLASGLAFRRGFVDEVKVTARQFLRHAHELFSAGPIRHVHLLDVGSSLDAVMQSPYLGRLTALTVWAQHAGEPLARSVARSPHLSGLRSLSLGRNRLTDDAAEHLATSPLLANLEEIDLSENELGETGARALAASPFLTRLRRLELSGNQVGPAGAEVLAGSDRLVSLSHLGLGYNALNVPRLHALARVADLLRVPTLDLTGNALGPLSLAVILAGLPVREAEASVRLRDLDLSHNELGEAGARVLAEARTLEGLKSLRLRGCLIPDDGLQHLARSPHLTALPSLDLGNNPISDRGLRAFLDTPHLRGLRHLVVPGVGVTKEMREALKRRFRGGVERF
jgi:uncharacterized protein (TIGR02996 family)